MAAWGGTVEGEHSRGFLARVTHELRGYAQLKSPEAIVRAVFRVLTRHVSKGEIEQVHQLLPAEIREFW